MKSGKAAVVLQFWVCVQLESNTMCSVLSKINPDPVPWFQHMEALPERKQGKNANKNIIYVFISMKHERIAKWPKVCSIIYKYSLGGRKVHICDWKSHTKISISGQIRTWISLVCHHKSCKALYLYVCFQTIRQPNPWETLAQHKMLTQAYYLWFR